VAAILMILLRINWASWQNVISRPSVVVCRYLSVTLCIVPKRCVLQQKLLLTAFRKSYMRNLLVAKWMTLV